MTSNMTSIKQYMMNIFNKYSIYNKEEFLNVTIYIITLIMNNTILYEQENQYCLNFYNLLLNSISYSSESATLLKRLISSKIDSTFTLDTITIPTPILTVSRVVELSYNLLSKKVILISDLEEIEEFSVSSQSTSVTINNVTSNTARGCIWKLLYIYLNYSIINNI